MVSVIIATHKRKDLLIFALEKIFQQKNVEMEVVVVNDIEEPDETDGITDLFPNIIYIKQASSIKGPSDSHKKGFSITTGEYVYMPDDDDYLLDDHFLEKSISILRNDPTISFVSGNARLRYDDENRNAIKWKDTNINLSGKIGRKEYLQEFQHKYMKPYSTVSTLFRRTALNANMIEMNDSSIYIEALFNGDAYILDDMVACYRIAAKGQNLSSAATIEFIVDVLKQKEQFYFRSINYLPRSKDFWYYLFSVTYIFFSKKAVSKKEKYDLIKWGLKHSHGSVKVISFLLKETLRLCGFRNYVKSISRIIRVALRELNDIGWFLKRRVFITAWCRYDGDRMIHNNWGDDVNVLFFESISKYKFKVIKSSDIIPLFSLNTYSCIGSILGENRYFYFPSKKYEVWGSGFLEKKEGPISIPKKVHSVRGPLTRQELLGHGIECPERYGDPALLISRYYRPSFEKKYWLGIIPHFEDIDNPALTDFCRSHPEVLVIKMRGYDDWLDIPRQICSCEKIISSSLHGLIMADSYRVPNMWVRFSDHLDDFKYLDYFASVGRTETTAHYVRSEADIEKIVIKDFPIAASDKIDYKGIFDACPFKEKLTDYRTLIQKLPEYKSFAEKETHYFANEYVNCEAELDEVIMRLKASEQSLIFRGASEANCKMFASSQHHWQQKTDWVARMGKADYHDFVEEIIRRAECLSEVQGYMQQQNLHTNDVVLFALMQHIGAPSPVIAFSKSLLTGLFFASDWDDSKWTDSRDKGIGDYISLYYISKEFDGNGVSVQSVMQRMTADTERIEPETMFMMNNTVDEPLVEVMNRQSKQKMFCCVNIHKKLLPYLRDKYLKPAGRTREAVNESCKQNVVNLTKAIKILS